MTDINANTAKPKLKHENLHQIEPSGPRRSALASSSVRSPRWCARSAIWAQVGPIWSFVPTSRSWVELAWYSRPGQEATRVHWTPVEKKTNMKLRDKVLGVCLPLLNERTKITKKHKNKTRCPRFVHNFLEFINSVFGSDLTQWCLEKPTFVRFW